MCVCTCIGDLQEETQMENYSYLWEKLEDYWTEEYF